MKHKAKVEKGKVVLFFPQMYADHLKTLEGKHIDLIIKLPHKPRNLDQNARHWARMTYAAMALGDRTPEELHYDFCSYFLTDRTKTPPKVKGSSQLTTAEFSRWEEDIDRILAELGIVIPDEYGEK